MILTHLFCSYNVLSKLLDNFGLIIEHAKTENFHFNRLHRIFNPPLLDLLLIGGLTLCPKDTWKYLSFIFNHKLMFHQHIDYYLNKAISTVKCMKLLGNLSQGINPLQKCQLYWCYVLPIALYGFQLWFYNKAPMLYHMKILNKMQRRAAIWVLEHSKPCLQKELKQSLELYLLNSTFKNSLKDLKFVLSNFLPTTSSET